MADGSEKKVKLSFYCRPELAQAVRESVYKHRLTLEEFFESAAKLEIERLKHEPPKEPEKVVSLRKGRPIRPKPSGA